MIRSVSVIRNMDELISELSPVRARQHHVYDHKLSSRAMERLLARLAEKPRLPHKFLQDVSARTHIPDLFIYGATLQFARKESRSLTISWRTSFVGGSDESICFISIARGKVHFILSSTES